MREIKTACITQTLCFSNHDGETTEYAKKAIVQECEKYKAQLEKSGTEYRILSEKTNEDGSIVIEIKKQYNTTAAKECNTAYSVSIRVPSISKIICLYFMLPPVPVCIKITYYSAWNPYCNTIRRDRTGNYASRPYHAVFYC